MVPRAAAMQLPEKLLKCTSYRPAQTYCVRNSRGLGLKICFNNTSSSFLYMLEVWKLWSRMTVTTNLEAGKWHLYQRLHDYFHTFSRCWNVVNQRNFTHSTDYRHSGVVSKWFSYIHKLLELMVNFWRY